MTSDFGATQSGHSDACCMARLFAEQLQKLIFGQQANA